MYLCSYQTKRCQTPFQHSSRVNLKLWIVKKLLGKEGEQGKVTCPSYTFALEILFVPGNADRNRPWHQVEEDQAVGENKEK